MKDDPDQRRFNLFWLHCRAAFWRLTAAWEPPGSEDAKEILCNRDRAVGELRRAQLAREERRLNKGRDN